jgi:TolA-binding protein
MAGVALVLVGVVVGFLGLRALRPELPRATVVATSGEVARGAGAAARAGDVLALGEGLQTGPDAQASLALPAGAVVLDADSALAVESIHPTRLALESGSLAADARSGLLAIAARGVEITASVALFFVRFEAAGTAVDVASGEVEVVEGAQRWRLRKGEAWRSGDRVPAGASAIAPEKLALLDGVETRSNQTQLRVEGTPAYRISVDGRALGHAPVSVLAEEGPHRIRASSPDNQFEVETPIRRGEPTVIHVAPPVGAAPPSPSSFPTSAPSNGPSRVAPEREPHQVISAARPEASAAPRVVAPPQHVATVRHSGVERPVAVKVALLEPRPGPPLSVSAADPIAAPPPPSDDYAQALQLEHTGRAAAAASLLARLVREHAPRSDLALYELGRLDQRALGDLAAARDAFAEYKAEYPSGALRQEVALSAIEVDLALDPPHAAKGIQEFLARYPHNERAREMRFIRANILREAGSCSAALADYQALQGTEYASEALFFTACCQREIGDLAAAERTLRSYLDRYPSGLHRAEVERALSNR